MTHAVTLTSPATSAGAGERRLGEDGLALTDEKGRETGLLEGKEGRRVTEEPPAGNGRLVAVNDTETSYSGRRPGHGGRDGSKKRERKRRDEEKDGRGKDLKAHPSKTAPHTTTNITPSHTPCNNTKAIFGPPVNFGVAPSTSVPPKAPPPGDSTWPTTTSSSVPSTAHRTSGRHAKIELPEGEMPMYSHEVDV